MLCSDSIHGGPMDKQQRRQEKALHRMMKHQTDPRTGTVDCACVIHGDAYDWRYVENLYNMLNRNLTADVRMHVYTEHDRSVPPHMIKHILEQWPGISGPRKSWWYKLQLFNPGHHRGNLLYFDLDTVICGNIDWIVSYPTDCLWTIRDFRYLQRSRHEGMNSSVMWWNTNQFDWLWKNISESDVPALTRRYAGDQDFLHASIDHNHKRYLPDNRVKSWRWQVLDGGYDFSTRRHRAPGTGARVDSDTSVLIFHGKPKPHQAQDPVVIEHWR